MAAPRPARGLSARGSRVDRYGWEPQARLFTPAFIALSLSDLAYFTAAGMLVAVTPLFVVGPLESGKAAVGIAMGAFSATTLMIRPLTGRWADRFGRRRLLVSGALLFTVLVAGHLVVTGLVGLVILRMLLGVAEALFFVAGFAALADLAPPGRAGAALSFNSLALYAGMAVGPVIGQALLRAGGFTAAWVGVTCLAGLGTVLATRVPETLERPAGPAVPGRLVHRAAVLPGLALFTGVAATAGFFAFAVLRAQEVGLERWSLVLLLFGAIIVVCRVTFADLPDRVPPIRLAAAALATLSVAAMLLSALPTVSGLLAGTALAAVAVAFLTPAIFASVFATTDASARGSAAATLSVFIDLWLGGGPMLVGFAAAGYGLGGGFAVAAAVAAGGALLLVARPRPSRSVREVRT